MKGTSVTSNILVILSFTLLSKCEGLAPPTGFGGPLRQNSPRGPKNAAHTPVREYPTKITPSVLLFAVDNNNNNNEEGGDGDSSSSSSSYEPQYGVSFIGGDPCGSKYNTDPHDARVEKPGMPQTMKDRIDALVAKRKKEEEEEKKKVGS